MERVEFLNRLYDLFEADPDTIYADLPLQDISGWDSLTFLGLLAMVNEQYHVAVSPHEVMTCGSVEDLYLLVSQRATRQAA